MSTKTPTDPPEPDDELDALIAGKRPLPPGLEALPPVRPDEPEPDATTTPPDDAPGTPEPPIDHQG